MSLGEGVTNGWQLCVVEEDPGVTALHFTATNNGGTLNINGGDVSNSGASLPAVFVRGGGRLNLYSGTVSSGLVGVGVGQSTGTAGEAHIFGGTVSAPSVCISITRGTATVSGGTVLPGGGTGCLEWRHCQREACCR